MRARTQHLVPPPFDPARPTLVRPVRVDPQGRVGPTRAQSRGGRWRRTTRGYFVPAYVDSTIPEQRIVEAAHFLTGESSVTGWAALRWHGAEWIDGTARAGEVERAVRIATTRGAMRSQPGAAVTSEYIPPRDRMVVDGLRVVTPVCAVAFEMRYAPSLAAAVRAFDMAAAADLVSKAELLEHFELLYHWIGIPRARKAAQLVDENAWSPTEVDVRLAWPLELGLTPPLTNRPVFDRSGRHLGTPDLIDVEAGLAIDYDGALHLAGERRSKDLVREDGFRGVGLEYLTLVSADRRDRGRLTRRILAARSRAPYSSPVDRAWTLEAPPWWVPTHTVDLRRRLTADQRERFLGYRRAS
ncbi:hypothetical protein [Nocardioides soli]|uniref:AbiEi antitoxin C-terminal domain-containing protein n=1 Tax=Nocardioides soli TaxID=1036020 RepID=A0A7W4VUY3_9ACTN|nr:hypothetical protein [Nocardioides soli]MBB3042266.1 hypothetical protein [Nocardioides soli]